MLPLPRDTQRFFLMEVQSDLFTEEARGFRKDDAFPRKRLQVRPALEGGVQLQDRVGPEPPLIERIGDVLQELRVKDIDEALNVALILADDLVAQCKYVKWHSIVRRLLRAFKSRFLFFFAAQAPIAFVVHDFGCELLREDLATGLLRC